MPVWRVMTSRLSTTSRRRSRSFSVGSDRWVAECTPSCKPDLAASVIACHVAGLHQARGAGGGRLPGAACGGQGSYNRSAVTVVRSEPAPLLSWGISAEHTGVVPPEAIAPCGCFRDHKDRRRKVECLKQRPRVIEDAGIGVVERYGCGAAQRCTARETINELRERYEIVVGREPAHLPLEGG